MLRFVQNTDCAPEFNNEFDSIIHTPHIFMEKYFEIEKLLHRANYREFAYLIPR